jgi:hypothetical protein
MAMTAATETAVGNGEMAGRTPKVSGSSLTERMKVFNFQPVQASRAEVHPLNRMITAVYLKQVLLLSFDPDCFASYQ